jgi:hypothetical protein
MLRDMNSRSWQELSDGESNPDLPRLDIKWQAEIMTVRPSKIRFACVHAHNTSLSEIHYIITYSHLRKKKTPSRLVYLLDSHYLAPFY